jgi:hypothetical protein
MLPRPPARWPPLAIFAGTAAVIALTAVAIARYPGIRKDPAAPVFTGLLIVLLAGYAGIAVWGLRRRRPGRALGVGVGVVAGAAWSVEIWSGGPARLHGTTAAAVGAAFALLAVVVTLAAGPIAALAGRGTREAVDAGVYAGLASGILVYAYAPLMTLANLDVLGARADYRRQFAASNAANMPTFLVGDILAAATSHLAINLALGATGGAIGALIAAGRGARPRSPETLSTPRPASRSDRSWWTRPS